ncbi:hypothetical protein ABVT39_027109 [Epinephelus coioides]
MVIVSERDRANEGERTRAGSERGVQKAANKRDRNLKATMKYSIGDIKEEGKQRRGQDKTQKMKENGKITQDDRVKVKWRTQENERQIMKETDGESEEKEGESNYIWLQKAQWSHQMSVSVMF